MRRSATVALVLALLLAPGCAARAPIERPPAPQRPAQPVVPEHDEVASAARQHASRVADWQRRGVALDRRSRRMTQLQVVFANLNAVAHRPELPWQVHLVEDARIDAAPAGGGYVYVHDGLFGPKGLVGEEDDDELAALLAHAIAHTALGHASRGEASFTAEQEREADRLATLYMALAGYDPEAAPRVWARAVGSAERFVAAHPLDVERARLAEVAVSQVLPYYTPGRLNLRWEAILAAQVPRSAPAPAPAPAPEPTPPPTDPTRSRFARAMGDPVRAAEVVSPDGFKGVRIGMTLEEATAAYGAALIPTDGLAPARARCFHVSPAYRSGAFALLVVQGRIARIDVFAPGPTTAEGVGVGSPEVDVLRAYAGRVRAEPYFLTAEPRDGFAIWFETDGTAVTQFRAGAPSDVRRIQGCP